MKTSTIALALVHREGSASKQERSTFDYIIDGESLGTRLEIATLDFVGRLDAEHPHRNTEALASLVGDGAADIADPTMTKRYADVGPFSLRCRDVPARAGAGAMRCLR